MQTKRRSRERVGTGLGYPIYQILFPVYVPLFLLSNNWYLFDLSDIIRTLQLSIATAVCLFAGLLCLYRDSHKAAVVTSAGFILFYSSSLVRVALPMPSSGVVANVLLAGAFLFTALFTSKARSVGPKLSKILNGVFAAMFILPIYKIAVLEIQFPGQIASSAINEDFENAPGASRPNIIHIVLDGYSRADVLQQLYSFDNSEIVQSLRDLGFAVAPNSTSPYNQTLLAMNSVFSLNYINDRVAKLSATTNRDHMRLALNEYLQDSEVLTFLQATGYSIVSVESLYPGVRLANADSIVPPSDVVPGLNLFETMLLTLTPIHTVIETLPLTDPTYSQVRFSIENQSLGDLQPPYFVYNHIIAPHPPFSVTADGEYRYDFCGLADGSHREADEQLRHANYRTGYIEKLQFTNRAILKIARQLLNQVPVPKIILIHSDHGGGMYFDQENRHKTCLKERFANFLAVYSNDPALAGAVAGQTNLVNLYRTVLSNVFGANYPPLPNRNYFVTWSGLNRFELLDEEDLATFGRACRQKIEPIARPTGPMIVREPHERNGPQEAKK